MRELVNKIRNSISEITSDIMSRILNLMTPLIETIVTIKSMVGKSNGILTAVIYTLLGVYLAIKSLIGSILEIVIIILIAMAAAIILLFFIPIVRRHIGSCWNCIFCCNCNPNGISYRVFKSNTQRAFVKEYSKRSRLIYFILFILGIIIK